ncbi:phage tail tape measure protein [Vibrio cincinnatiensis]|uniref:phage tail tape measure protein n=1 Tax=Vibrio cincinnatiensis TaxID=675 RepID=UPI0013028F7F|nr:phage tail tape measure protein [Vibrio cincinnatiensis]
MADKTQTVGIGLEARVDRSVSRAFSDVEQQNKRLGRDTQRLGRDTRRLGNESAQTGSRVGRLGRTIGRTRANLKQYVNGVGEAIRKNDLLRRSASKAGEAIDEMVGNKWSALASGAAGAGSAVAVMGLEERYERLGIQAGKSREEMAELRKEMFATSQQSDIRVDQGEMLSAVEKIVEKTGDLKFAEENMANIGRVMQATGAAGVDAGEMFADMRDKFGLKNADEVLSAMDTLVVQGKAGAFTLQNLAAEGAAVSAAYAAMGRTGPKAVQEMGAMLQVARMGSGSAAEAASSMESVLADITSNYEKIEDLGIEVFDEEALARGEKKFRDIPSILKEIMESTDSDITEYSQLFGEQSMRMMKVLASDTGKSKLNDFLAIDGDGTAVLQDSARAAMTANAAMTSLKTAWLSFADTNLAEPIAAIADAINSIDPKAMQTTLKVATGLAATLAGIWAIRKTKRIGSSIMDFVRGGASASSGGADLPGSNGVQNVYVTNMPSEGLSTTRGGRRRRRARGRSMRPRASSLRGAANFARSGRSFLSGAARKLPYLGAALGIADIGTTLMDSSLSKADKSREVGGTIGNMGGMAAGAMAGAALGSVVPVIGTAIGGVIGGALGGLGGSSVGRWIGGWFGGNDKHKADMATTEKSVQVAASKSNTSSKIQPSTFAPVFHITGEVSNEQLKKLEAMVIRVKKQLDRQSRSGSPAFAD